MFAFLVADHTQLPSEDFTGSLHPAAGPDGAFSSTFPIPSETPGGTWRFGLTCIFTDVATQGPQIEVDVAPGTVEHLTFDANPNPGITGDALHLSGRACKAQGRPLGRIVVSLSHTSGDQIQGPNQTVTPADDGSWQATLEVPQDFAPTNAVVDLQCDDTIPNEPSWGRFLRAPIAIVAGAGPTSIESTVPATTADTLARTGSRSSGQVASGSLVLIAVGLSLLGIGSRRRPRNSDC